MYNGLGLRTPRGSATSGYIQRNESFVKPRIPGSAYRMDQLPPPKPPVRPSQEIMVHRAKRQIEIQCIQYESALRLSSSLKYPENVNKKFIENSSTHYPSGPDVDIDHDSSSSTPSIKGLMDMGSSVSVEKSSENLIKNLDNLSARPNPSQIAFDDAELLQTDDFTRSVESPLSEEEIRRLVEIKKRELLEALELQIARQDTSYLKQQKDKEIDRIRGAFGISPDAVVGAAFNFENDLEKQQRRARIAEEFNNSNNKFRQLHDTRNSAIDRGKERAHQDEHSRNQKNHLRSSKTNLDNFEPSKTEKRNDYSHQEHVNSNSNHDSLVVSHRRSERLPHDDKDHRSFRTEEHPSRNFHDSSNDKNTRSRNYSRDRTSSSSERSDRRDHCPINYDDKNYNSNVRKEKDGFHEKVDGDDYRRIRRNQDFISNDQNNRQLESHHGGDIREERRRSPEYDRRKNTSSDRSDRRRR